MKLEIKKATTDVTLYLFIQDSSVTTGAGKTGLAYNTASLVCYYVRPLGSATAITLATQTVGGAHSDGGFVEVDSTNMPGVYRLDLPDAVCATGVNSAVVMLKGAANMAPVLLEVQLVSYDPNDTVRLGLTALPNAAAEAAGGLFTRGTGAGQIAQDANGRIDVNVAAISTDSVAADNLESYTDGTTPMPVNATQISGDSVAADNLEAAADGTGYNLGNGSIVAASVTGAVGSVTGNVGGNVSGSVGSVTGNVGGNVTGSVGSVATGGITRASLAAETGLQSVRSNTAQTGAAGSITLDASASATDDIYNDCVVYITGGTGVGQARLISDYVGATKVASVLPNWATNPDNTSTFAILPSGRVDVGQWVDSAPNALVSGRVDSDMGAISADSAAADNAESFFDGTGYAGTNNTIPTVTTVTNMVTANVTQLSGDSVAADNAEAFFDGTGYAGTNNVIPTVTTVSNAVTVGTNNDKTDYRLSATGVDDVLDEVVEGSYTLRQYLRAYAAALLGKLSGAATTTVVVRDTGDSKNRISATVDADGNRSAVTLDVT